MLEWIAYKNSETLGKRGLQDGIIIFDEELPKNCRLTIEKMKDGSYMRICDIYADSFRFSFFSDEAEALKSSEELKKEMVEWIHLYPSGVSQIGCSGFSRSAKIYLLASPPIFDHFLTFYSFPPHC